MPAVHTPSAPPSARQPPVALGDANSEPQTKVSVAPPGRPDLPSPSAPDAGANPPESLPVRPVINRPDPATNLYFEPRSSELGREAQTTLAALAGQLTADRGLRVRLYAHTDDLGSNAYCVALAAQRATAVAAELVRQGVYPRQVRRRIVGCEIAPGPPCTEEACRQLRRRVEFKVTR